MKKRNNILMSFAIFLLLISMAGSTGIKTLKRELMPVSRFELQPRYIVDTLVFEDYSKHISRTKQTEYQTLKTDIADDPLLKTLSENAQKHFEHDVIFGTSGDLTIDYSETFRSVLIKYYDRISDILLTTYSQTEKDTIIRKTVNDVSRDLKYYYDYYVQETRENTSPLFMLLYRVSYFANNYGSVLIGILSATGIILLVFIVMDERKHAIKPRTCISHGLRITSILSIVASIIAYFISAVAKNLINRGYADFTHLSIIYCIIGVASLILFIAQDRITLSNIHKKRLNAPLSKNDTHLALAINLFVASICVVLTAFVVSNISVSIKTTSVLDNETYSKTIYYWIQDFKSDSTEANERFEKIYQSMLNNSTLKFNLRDIETQIRKDFTDNTQTVTDATVIDTFTQLIKEYEKDLFDLLDTQRGEQRSTMIKGIYEDIQVSSHDILVRMKEKIDNQRDVTDYSSPLVAISIQVNALFMVIFCISLVVITSAAFLIVILFNKKRDTHAVLFCTALGNTLIFAIFSVIMISFSLINKGHTVAVGLLLFNAVKAMHVTLFIASIIQALYEYPKISNESSLQ